MILAQLSVYPIGEGTSLGSFVRKGIQDIPLFPAFLF